MSLRLVSEAGPILWERLPNAEKEQLNEANRWIDEVAKSASHSKCRADRIDKHRSGRVLFIDGKRGAGKTSLLLTLLQLWREEQKPEQYEPKKTHQYDPPKTKVGVLLPVLDFDPIPRGMPLHGWLLEPWRKVAKDLEKDEPGSEDLSELWTDLFERVVTGWTEAAVAGKGVVETAIAYQEQSAGWIDTSDTWRKFVNAAVCRSVKCPKHRKKEECRGEHAFVFVVAIDDVDLQVEQVPSLLHALRLLHHPNVAYVLTGDIEHLSFVIQLDYMGRHEQLTHLHREGARGVDAVSEMEHNKYRYSRELSEALIEKALPSHARIKLENFSLKDVLALTVGSETAATDAQTLNPKEIVALIANEKWRAIAEQAKELPIATAREAQHSIDRHFERSLTKLDSRKSLEFFADLCGTTVENREEERKGNESAFRINLSGRVTTQLGPILRAWEGDRLRIVVTERPPFAFRQGFDESNVLFDKSANRAVAVQLCVEKNLARAPRLDWIPDFGVAATEVQWTSKVAKVEGFAIFRWPWLVRPTASQVLKLDAVAQVMIRDANDNSRSKLDRSIFVRWLTTNIQWWYEQNEDKGDCCPVFGAAEKASFGAAVDALHKVRELEKSDGDERDRTNVKRWVGELVVMTAPYFGIPSGASDVAAEMRKALEGDLMPELETIKLEQKRMVNDAIILGQSDVARIGHRALESKNEPSSSDYDDAVKDFLAQRWDRSKNDAWWALAPHKEETVEPQAELVKGDQAK